MRRNEPELLQFGREQRFLSRRILHQQVIRADAFRILHEAQAAGGVRLRVAIDEQSIHFGSRERRSQVDSGRGLAYAALLVGNSNNASH